MYLHFCVILNLAVSFQLKTKLIGALDSVSEGVKDIDQAGGMIGLVDDLTKDSDSVSDSARVGQKSVPFHGQYSWSILFILQKTLEKNWFHNVSFTNTWNRSKQNVKRFNSHCFRLEPPLPLKILLRWRRDLQMNH